MCALVTGVQTCALPIYTLPSQIAFWSLQHSNPRPYCSYVVGRQPRTEAGDPQTTNDLRDTIDRLQEASGSRCRRRSTRSSACKTSPLCLDFWLMEKGALRGFPPSWVCDRHKRTQRIQQTERQTQGA